jgi:hypothetical protein
VADDLASFPIVVLEADHPERVGKVGLFDYLMPVGATGIVFVAAVPGRLYEWGPTFTDEVKQASNLRAASTLAHMGLIRGETFAFLREALQLSQADIAALFGVSEATVQGWEDNTIPIPTNAWGCTQSRVCIADGRQFLTQYALEPDFRPRKIRVFPEAPMPLEPVTPTPPCDPPVPLVGPDCEPPVNPC